MRTLITVIAVVFCLLILLPVNPEANLTFLIDISWACKTLASVSKNLPKEI